MSEERITDEWLRKVAKDAVLAKMEGREPRLLRVRKASKRHKPKDAKDVHERDVYDN